jgi:butyryl-CoA dehydrogenase
LVSAVAAQNALARAAVDREFYEGKLCAAQYFIRTEVPRIAQLLELCRSGEDSYARMRPEWF